MNTTHETSKPGSRRLIDRLRQRLVSRVAIGAIAAVSIAGLGGIASTSATAAPATAPAPVTVESAATAPVRQYQDPFGDMTNDEVDALSDDDWWAIIDDWYGVEEYADEYDDWTTEEEYDGQPADEYYDDWTTEAEPADDYLDDDYDDWTTNDEYYDEYYDDEPTDEYVDDEAESGDDEWFVPEGAEWDDHGHDHDHDVGEETLSGTLPVDRSTLDTSGISASQARTANELWNRFTKLIPADQRTMVSGFEVLPNDTGAHVYVDENDATKWVLGLGSDLGAELDEIIVHEFAHLLTLKASQVQPTVEPGSCPTYYPGEGCALQTSTLNQFVNKFWPESLRTENANIASDRQSEQFLAAHGSKFVTDYAATNPEEDIAETFATFVMNDRPTGTTIADQKVEFMWNDAKLLALRNQIRANMN